MRKLTGAVAPLDTILLAIIADAVRILVWQNTKDGIDGKNQPKSILEMMTGPKPTEGFDSVEEFRSWRASMLGGEDDA